MEGHQGARRTVREHGWLQDPAGQALGMAAHCGPAGILQVQGLPLPRAPAAALLKLTGGFRQL